MSGHPIASLNNVSVRFGRRWVLVRLTAEFEKGKKILLTGGNGAGKTTLLRVLGTALKPSRGTLSLFGQDAHQHRDAVRPRVGLLTHESYLYDALTARQNLKTVCDLAGYDVANIPDLLQRVGLSEHADRSVGQYSAGMKRRLCFARLLLGKPELVLLDEPFGQLDPEGVEDVTQLIEQFSAADTTVILSTHDVPRGERMCDEHRRLEQGVLRQVAS